MDIVIGHHYSSPWLSGGVPVRLYLNRGLDGGIPRFEDVTEKVGLKPLPMKAPHVELQDFDNDGWPDLYTSIVKFAGGKPHRRDRQRTRLLQRQGTSSSWNWTSRLSSPPEARLLRTDLSQ